MIDVARCAENEMPCHSQTFYRNAVVIVTVPTSDFEELFACDRDDLVDQPAQVPALPIAPTTLTLYAALLPAGSATEPQHRLVVLIRT